MRPAPRTYQDLLIYFGADRNAGRYNLDQIDMLYRLGDRRGSGEVDDAGWCLYLWHEIEREDFCRSIPQYGWITPKGAVWSVDYASHEALIYRLFGLEIREVEMAGWLRVSDNAKYVLPRLTRAQLDAHARLFSTHPLWCVADEVEVALGSRPKRVPVETPFDYRPKDTVWTHWAAKPLSTADVVFDPYQMPAHG